MLQREELARVALSAGDVTTDELDAFVADLEADRSELENKNEQAQNLAVSLISAQEETEQLKTDYQAARVRAEEELGQAILEEEQRRAAAAAAAVQAQIAASQAAANNNSNSSSSNSGNGGASTNSGNSGNSGGATTTSSGGGNTDSGSGGDSGGSSTPAVSSLASVAVNAALGQQGVPYRYATSSPGVNFDCSGLTKYAWGKAGVYLPHQSAQQYASMPHVSQAAAQPGDLLFYYSPISHVGVYLGGGQLVHAPATGDVVKVSSVNWSKVSGVGRPG